VYRRRCLALENADCVESRVSCKLKPEVVGKEQTLYPWPLLNPRVSATRAEYGIAIYDGGAKQRSQGQNDVAAVNRTRGSCMASTNFTTKPLRQMIGRNENKKLYIQLGWRFPPLLTYSQKHLRNPPSSYPGMVISCPQHPSVPSLTETQVFQAQTGHATRKKRKRRPNRTNPMFGAKPYR
jgi:hypothetical protein